MYPATEGFTIYSKLDCIYCDLVKELLRNEKVHIIPCDDEIDNDRDAFLAHMDSITERRHRTFPFVFHHGGFIGGYEDTRRYLEHMMIFTADF